MRTIRTWQKTTAFALVFAVIANFFLAQNNFATQGNIEQLNAKKSVFLSDLKYDKEKSRAGWNILLYDKNVKQGQLSLTVNGKREFFSKGVFAHADSLVAYNIEGLQFDRLQGYFGIDAAVTNETDGVKLLIYADDITKNLVAEDTRLNSTLTIGQSVFFDIEIPAGTKYLYIGADKAGHNKSDWATFGGVKLIKNGYVAPKLEGVESLEKLDEKLRTYNSATEAIAQAEFDVLKRALIKRTGYRQLIEMMDVSEERRLAIEWLMQDVKHLKDFMMAGEPNSNYSDAFQVLGRLLKKHGRDLSDNTPILRGTRGDLYNRMMMSLAVAHSGNVCFWLDNRSCSDAVERYELYKEMHANGLLRNDIFETIEAEEMRWIMEGMLSNKELKWLNYYSRVRRLNKKSADLTEADIQNLKNVQPHLDPYVYIRYTFDYKYDLDKYYTGDGTNWKQKYGFDEFDISYGLTNINGSEQKVRKLWMVFEEGAVCGGISKTGTNLWTAFGMPASVNGQPGHAAYLQYGVQGAENGKTYTAENGEDYRAGIWWLGNNISGWVESEKGERLLAGWGYNRDRRNKDELGGYNVSYVLLAQNNLNRYADFVKAREMAMYAEIFSEANVSGSPKDAGQIVNIEKADAAKTADLIKGERIYDELLNVTPRDYEAWKGLVISYLKDRSKSESDYVTLAGRLAEGLKEYPLPMADLINALEEATKDASHRSSIRQLRNAALEKAIKGLPKNKDFLQPDAARDMANRILGRQEEMVKFSFDGNNAGSIVLGSKYASGETRYEYSLDGKHTWKETSDKIHKLSEDELAELTEEHDIVVHFIGDGGKFGDGGNLDANNPEHIRKHAIVIDIKRHATPRVAVNDLENKVVGDIEKLEWKAADSNTWNELTNETRFDGDKTIMVRKRNSGTSLFSEEVALGFKPNEENKAKQYVPSSRIKIKSVSSEQADRNNRKEYALDGNPETFWHSAWNGSDSKREIVLELDKVIKLKAFEYMPRQDVSGANGTVTVGEILTSEDGVNFTSAKVANWARNSVLKRVEFENPIKAKFVKFVGREATGGYIAAAMINLYEDATAETEPEQPKPPVVQPEEPVKPKPAEPAQPGQPKPAEPSEPAKPVQPSEPVKPVKPKPAEPSVPSQPKPAEPKPVQPSEPKPSEPVKPKPAEPAQPSQPSTPNQPAKPNQPVQPSKPVDNKNTGQSTANGQMNAPAIENKTNNNGAQTRPTQNTATNQGSRTAPSATTNQGSRTAPSTGVSKVSPSAGAGQVRQTNPSVNQAENNAGVSQSEQNTQNGQTNQSDKSSGESQTTKNSSQNDKQKQEKPAEAEDTQGWIKYAALATVPVVVVASGWWLIAKNRHRSNNNNY